MFKRVFCVLATISLVTLQSMAIGGETGSGGGDNSSSGKNNNTLNSYTTNQVIRFLRDGANKCVRLERFYRHDCYRYHFGRAAEVLDGSLAYSLAHDELRNVERTLREVVNANLDPSKKPVRRGLKTYKAIKPAAVPQANAQAEQVMQRAETVLLRSSGARQTHYARIAEAVNSNKVLLRSAWLPGGLLRVAWSLLQYRSS